MKKAPAISPGLFFRSVEGRLRPLPKPAKGGLRLIKIDIGDRRVYRVTIWK